MAGHLKKSRNNYCVLCKTKHKNKFDAEECYRRGKIIADVKKAFQKGKFLIKTDKSILPVLDMDCKEYSPCQDNDIGIRLADKYCRKVYLPVIDELLGIKSISITEAVKLGWRVIYRSAWGSYVSDEMQKEYKSAIKEIIKSMPNKEKADLLLEKVAFPSNYEG
jgi:hypothetical protein